MSLFRILLATGLLAGAAWAQPQLINGVAVVVNDAVITYQDVRLYVAQTFDLLDRQYGNQPLVLAQRRKEIIEDGMKQLVERQLILHDFKTTATPIPESIIDDNIRDRIRQRFGDRATLARTLKAEGLTMETYRKRVREEIIIEAMRYQHVSKDLIISPQKILRYYEDNKTNYMIADQVKLRMIVLNKPAGGDGGVTTQLAKEILGKIKGGATFEEMARIHSEGSQRLDGGNWGWVERKVLRKELGDVAFTLPKGSMSDVIDLPEACFLMFVEDTRPSHVKPLPDVRDEIEKNLLMKERARLQDQWIARLRAKSFVQTYTY
jgi:peptidyl-prolyl cis-trans isomerase SurA